MPVAFSGSDWRSASSVELLVLGQGIFSGIEGA